MSEKVFVVSLPRTGTKSMCQMLKDLGYDVKHVAGPYLEAFAKKHDALADTPVFAYYAIDYLLKTYPTAKFIYIEKDFKEWFDSMVKVNLARNFNKMLSQDYESLSNHSKADLDSLVSVFGKLEISEDNYKELERKFFDHRVHVFEEIPSEQLLFYRFSMGWQPLCDFLNKPTPVKDVPHLNQDTMFDNLN
jgi:hypothetical protein